MTTKKTLSLIMVFLISFSIVAYLDVSKAQVVNPVGIDSGLVGYWRFDENSGVSALDSSGNSYTGIVSGAIWVNGKYNSALQFNGVAIKKVTIPVINGLTSFTISLWWKWNNNSGGVIADSKHCLIRNINGESGNYISVEEDGTVGYVNIDSLGVSAGRNIFQPSNFNMLTAIWNGTHLTMVTNTTRGTSFILNSLPSGSDSLLIGEYSDSGNYYVTNGIIDEIRIYNRTLSDSEISILYNGVPITVTHDLGSIVSPNGTVYVGVDQSQTFYVNSQVGYIPWSLYLDGIAYAPNPVYLLSGVQSNHTIYATSQYLGVNQPTLTPILNTPIPSNGSIFNYFGNFDSIAQLMLVGVIAVFLLITAFILFARKRRRF